MLLKLECYAVLCASLLALAAPRLSSHLFAPLRAEFFRIGSRRRLSVLIVTLLALGIRLALLAVEPVPKPALNDEFSYLLMADTFAHGRATNPTHPMWIHFETFHVNQIPTYCSMYYPGQGLLLAFGQKLGDPFWGVLLSAVLMCGAFCWALQAWMPAPWALIGGLLALMRLATFSYWGNSYWGGTLPALGGALVLGSLPRIWREIRSRDAVVLALGLAILANTRPYEGLFFCAPALFILCLRLRKRPLKMVVRRVVAPALALLLPAVVAMGFYFWRCTGSPLRTPYIVNVQTYEMAPLFPWQGLRTDAVYRHPVLREFFAGYDVQQYEESRHNPLLHLAARLVKAELFLGGAVFPVPWIALLFILPYSFSLRDLGSKDITLLAICLFSAIGMALPIYFEPHYAAPVSCALYALQLQAFRRVRIWDRKRSHRGAALLHNVIIVCVFLFVVRACIPIFHLHAPGDPVFTWSGPGAQDLGRAEFEHVLAQIPGKHLVIVRYGPNHDPHKEWVYNAADIDKSRIIWARDMTPAKNQELIEYFKNRQVWLLEPDSNPRNLRPYQ